MVKCLQLFPKSLLSNICDASAIDVSDLEEEVGRLCVGGKGILNSVSSWLESEIDCSEEVELITVLNRAAERSGEADRLKLFTVKKFPVREEDVLTGFRQIKTRRGRRIMEELPEAFEFRSDSLAFEAIGDSSAEVSGRFKIMLEADGLSKEDDRRTLGDFFMMTGSQFSRTIAEVEGLSGRAWYHVHKRLFQNHFI